MSRALSEVDPDIYDLIVKEAERQHGQIELIASENFTSEAVLEATGSVYTNKYAEGYPGKRYYGGCEFTDEVENIARDRAKKLFGAEYANVQPHSCSQANQAAYGAVLSPVDTIMGLDLAHGGHLTHGHKLNFSGKTYHVVAYQVRREDERVDFDLMQKLADENKPKMIIAGGSAYPRQWDFKRLREVADSVGALLLVDMAHFSGLVAAGLHPNPCEYADIVENLAIERAKKLFGCDFANVQPNSGSQMNQAVFLALLEPGDTFMGLSLAAGGHLTHGSPVNMSGKWFNVVPYGVRKDDQRLDMDEIAQMAREHKPKLIIAGATAYPRHWDFARFREIADEVGAYLLVDMSHFSGLVAGGAHPNPFPHAHVVTTTTHKSLRGPRSGVILTNDEDLAKRFNMAVFPGLQGGPLVHDIAAKAVAFQEALRPEFRTYARRVVENAQALAASLQDHGLDIVSGGTDNHLMLVDLTRKDVTGKATEKGLDRAYLTCNKNAIPFDQRSPFVTSGVRLGAPAATTRGFGPEEFRTVGQLIAEVVEGMRKNGEEGDAQVEESVRRRVTELCDAFPVYPGR